MSRESRGNFADFSSNTLQQQQPQQPPRKKPALDDRRPQLAQPYIGPTSLVWTSPSVKARAASLRRTTTTHQPGDRPPDEKLAVSAKDDDDLHRGSGVGGSGTGDDAGDLLNGVGSASSHASTASSVFSSSGTAHPSTMSGCGPTTSSSSIHALTPLTNTDSSPPGKTVSPRSARPFDDALHPNSAAGAFDAPGGSDVSETITPIHTPPENRLQARPGPGQEKGFKLVYDPDRDKELTREQKKRRVAEPIVFGLGVSWHPFPPLFSICECLLYANGFSFLFPFWDFWSRHLILRLSFMVPYLSVAIAPTILHFKLFCSLRRHSVFRSS
jgi:hypothetical protein